MRTEHGGTVKIRDPLSHPAVSAALDKMCRDVIGQYGLIDLVPGAGEPGWLEIADISEERLRQFAEERGWALTVSGRVVTITGRTAS